MKPSLSIRYYDKAEQERHEAEVAAWHASHHSGSCDNCGKRPGTCEWVGDGGWLAHSHGMYEMWCEVCVIEAQIDHAEKAAGTLQKLRARLAELVEAEQAA